MLEIALTPAPVARRKVDERRRTFFVTTAKARQHIDSVTSAPDQCGLDKIMAENVTAERRAPAQHRQAAMRGESLGANDRVMAPVIAIASGGYGDTSGDHRPVDTGRELLKTGK